LASLYGVVRELIIRHRLAPSAAIACITRNPAAALGLADKGRVSKGADADLVVLDGDHRIETVLARGRIVVEGGRPVRRGMFDEIILDQIG
ncbi:MAG: amidohydrolase family protein, partial [Geminicoccaceae bacterium]|nr:amidohydrolase family protein [Geminicoccaceae bacterium]